MPGTDAAPLPAEHRRSFTVIAGLSRQRFHLVPIRPTTAREGWAADASARIAGSACWNNGKPIAPMGSTGSNDAARNAFGGSDAIAFVLPANGLTRRN